MVLNEDTAWITQWIYHSMGILSTFSCWMLTRVSIQLGNVTEFSPDFSTFFYIFLHFSTFFLHFSTFFLHFLTRCGRAWCGKLWKWRRLNWIESQSGFHDENGVSQWVPIGAPLPLDSKMFQLISSSWIVPVEMFQKSMIWKIGNSVDVVLDLR